MLLWAGNSIVGRAVRETVLPFTLAFGRWLGAFLVLTPFALRKAIEERAKILAHVYVLLLLGGLGVGAFNAFLYSGLRYTTATNALLMQATIPPLVLVLGRLLFKDRAAFGQMLGVLLSTIGVTVIVFRGDPGALTRLHVGQGDLLVVCGCLAWALYTVCLRLRPDLRPETFVWITFAIGVLTMAPLATLEASRGAQVVWNWGTAGALVYVALFPSVIAYFLYNGAVAEIGAGAAGQAICLMPLFGAGLAVPLLGEPLRSYHGVAMALILLGVALAAWASGRKANA
ncbi:DMT family transporter [Novosphingobium humi]|uniref:DMT family transporter n=1 Tax=Novosphingobium humi TaxID=2282397 RepID=A0ABY7U0V3_9SPHN|nr:DMT family transporter [Novosphingobium humi]WCT79156.1 DMT family transporter [Novosphingobium humi]